MIQLFKFTLCVENGVITKIKRDVLIAEKCIGLNAYTIQCTNVDMSTLQKLPLVYFYQLDCFYRTGDNLTDFEYITSEYMSLDVFATKYIEVCKKFREELSEQQRQLAQFIADMLNIKKELENENIS